MILLSLLLQILSFSISFLLAKNLIKIFPNTLTFENAYLKSKTLLTISFLSILVIFLGTFTFHNEDFFSKLPLLYQKYAMIITWITILSFIALLSGFILPITHKLKADKFKIYSIALIVLNIATFMNHYEKNAYGGDEIKETKAKLFVKQSTNYSCTSASIATVARNLDMNVTEKEVAELSRLTKLGANSGQVRYALDRLGIKYHTLTRKSLDPNKIKSPAILYVDNPIVGREGHAIVYLGKDHYGFQIWNPVGFKIYLSEEEFREVWHGLGMECSKGD